MTGSNVDIQSNCFKIHVANTSNLVISRAHTGNQEKGGKLCVTRAIPQNATLRNCDPGRNFQYQEVQYQYQNYANSHTCTRDHAPVIM